MASSGYFQNSFRSGGGYYLRVEWIINSQSTDTNTSNITVKAFLVSAGSGFYINSSAEKTIRLTINGTTYTKTAAGLAKLSGGEKKELISQTVDIEHDIDGAKSILISCSFDIEVTLSGKFYGTVNAPATGAETVVLDVIARPATLLTAPNFNDEGNPTITYSNPAGNSVSALDACISFTGATDNIKYRAILKTDSTYTFNLTDAERNTLRNSIPNSNSRLVKFYVRTTIGSKKYYSSVEKTFTIINGNPTLEPTVIDSNIDKTVPLTGDTNKLIKYYSNAEYIIGAVALKGATIVSQKVVNGSKTMTAATGTINGIESDTFVFTATDSRGNTTKQAVKKSIVNYINPTCNIGNGTPNAEGEYRFSVSGNYFNNTFGAVNNTLSIYYRYKTNNGEYGDWEVMSATRSGNTYSANVDITGLDYKTTYVFQAYAKDKLNTVYSTEKRIKTEPVFDWGANDFKHNTDVIMGNQKSIIGTRADGTTTVALEACNTSGNTVLGYGNYATNNGSTNIYGTNIRLYTKEKLIINDREYGQNSLLWSGAYYMNASQSITLPSPISAQPNGIILVFSLYRDGAPADASVCSFFVSKKEVELMPGAGHTFFLLINSGFSVMGAKYLTITDTQIAGNAINATDGTNNNMTYTNTSFVLRYVIGV